MSQMIDIFWGGFFYGYFFSISIYLRYCTYVQSRAHMYSIYIPITKSQSLTIPCIYRNENKKRRVFYTDPDSLHNVHTRKQEIQTVFLVKRDCFFP